MYVVFSKRKYRCGLDYKGGAVRLRFTILGKRVDEYLCPLNFREIGIESFVGLFF